MEPETKPAAPAQPTIQVNAVLKAGAVLAGLWLAAQVLPAWLARLTPRSAPQAATGGGPLVLMVDGHDEERRGRRRLRRLARRNPGCPCLLVRPPVSRCR